MVRRLILDTGVIVGFERQNSDLRAVIGDDEPAIAAITAMELLAGVNGVTSRHRDLVGLNVEALLTVMPVADYTVEVARVHAHLMKHTRLTGQPRSAFDLIIAATAAATGSLLLTTDAAARFDELPGVQAELVKLD
ncbi:PIN domain-containing protein [Actinophytocola gossypii]|uniref:Ribonuclease VapC n=1 Tax=Actinophytocola gossypii TaxID=2812003 RepID=A0ABT2J718_9PSEU|nr:PIN domain-containing protein [Actinophytocola gossypii]MCT2583593.1 PIN domain-containing protein [Actinophytocola gossypii]